mgnify:FL=1
MPFDLTKELDVPYDLDFDVEFEPTRVADKKYVINTQTGEPIAIIGEGATARSHGDFYRSVWDVMTNDLPASDLEDATVDFKSARNYGWTMLDVTLPKIKTTIRTKKHDTEISQRLIAVHGIDGTASPATWFGAIDFFCTNGMITGDYDKVRKKNTSGFTLSGFQHELSKAKTDFDMQGKKLQLWADTDLTYVSVPTLLDEIIKSERKSKKMYELYMQEASVRGHNKFALYSAFTNYASYADERNGFSLRNTGNDTQAVSMFAREQEVSKWISTPQFLEVA